MRVKRNHSVTACCCHHRKCRKLPSALTHFDSQNGDAAITRIWVLFFISAKLRETVLCARVTCHVVVVVTCYVKESTLSIYQIL